LRVCFYAAVQSVRLLDILEFYRQDLRILHDLGHSVRIATSPRHLPRRDDDLFWVWWPTSGAPAVVWADVRGRPSVLVTSLSERDRSASGLTSKSAAAKAAMRLALARADLTLATSEDTRRGLANHRVHRLRVAPHGVDTVAYAPVAGPRDGAVLTISQITADNVDRKRIVDVVRTAAAARDAGLGLRFEIAGRLADGTATVRAEIERLRVGDRVQLLGEVTPAEKVRLLQSCAAYFQPTRYEAFGLAIAEAMASGAAVVSSAVGNVPELVGNAGVLLSPHATADDMAAAVALAVREAAVLGASARERVISRYSLDVRRAAIASAIAEVRPPNG